MKIFILLSRFPYPLEKGDKLRAFHQVKQLAEKNDIFLFAMAEETLSQEMMNPLKPYCRSIKIVRLSRVHIFINLLRSLFLRLPFQVGYFFSPSLKNTVAEAVGKLKPDIIYCQLIRTSEYVRDIPSVPRVIDYMDAFSKGVERRMRKANIFLRPFFYMEYKRLLKYEQEVFDRFDAKVIISEQDRLHIPCRARDTIEVIPNGVDTSYFTPVKQDKDYDILFSGNMSYPPNVDSALYLVREIFPLLRKKNPDIRILIAGADPAPAVRALQSKNIHITGWLEDIRTAYARSRMLVAPMNMSIGMQNKILQAMSMELPCITSSLAANAIKGAPLIVAAGAQEYAVQIVRLLENPGEAASFGKKGRDFVLKNYSWKRRVTELESVFTRTLKEAKGRW